MERNIDDELLEMWNRFTDVVDSTRTKITKVVAPIIEPIEEKIAEHDGILVSIKRGIMNIATSFEKKK